MEKVKSVYVVIDGGNMTEYATKKSLQKAFSEKWYSAAAKIVKGKWVKIVTETVQQITVK